MVKKKNTGFCTPELVEAIFDSFAVILLNTIFHGGGHVAEIKTKKNTASVAEFIAAVANDTRREDASTVLKLMQKVTGKKPKMWGPSIVGFDEYHYRYDSGHEGDMCMIGFSPRASALTLYTLPAFEGRKELLARLGKHKEGKGCLYISKLADVDLKVLESIIRTAYTWMQQNHQDKS